MAHEWTTKKGKILAIKSKSHMIDPGINKLRDEVRNPQIQTKREMDPRPVVSIYRHIYIYKQSFTCMHRSFLVPVLST